MLVNEFVSVENFTNWFDWKIIQLLSLRKTTTLHNISLIHANDTSTAVKLMVKPGYFYCFLSSYRISRKLSLCVFALLAPRSK